MIKYDNMLRRTVRNIIKILMFVLIVSSVVIIAPFFTYSKKSYESICKDAAAYYGIEEGEYILHISKGKIAFAAEMVQGTMTTEEEEERKVYVINIETTPSRPMTIETIFHEFAHAAQTKYALDLKGYNREQHAELLAFSAMWRTKYWYNAVHMFTMHTAKLKPAEYLCGKQIWNTALTGIDTVKP